MNYLDSIAVNLALSVAFVIASSYTAGRMHQWYRHSFERDVAYRQGYHQASHSLFHLAVRNMPAQDRATAAVPPIDVDPQLTHLLGKAGK